MQLCLPSQPSLLELNYFRWETGKLSFNDIQNRITISYTVSKSTVVDWCNYICCHYTRSFETTVAPTGATWSASYYFVPNRGIPFLTEMYGSKRSGCPIKEIVLKHNINDPSTYSEMSVPATKILISYLKGSLATYLLDNKNSLIWPSWTSVLALL